MRRNANDEAQDIAATSMLPRAPKKYPILIESSFRTLQFSKKKSTISKQFILPLLVVNASPGYYNRLLNFQDMNYESLAYSGLWSRHGILGNMS